MNTAFLLTLLSVSLAAVVAVALLVMFGAGLVILQLLMDKLNVQPRMKRVREAKVRSVKSRPAPRIQIAKRQAVTFDDEPISAERRANVNDGSSILS